jgi:hypothetical protein
MKAIRRFWINIPRQVRICVNILIILYLLLTFYVSVGSPVFTLEQRFRRAEKAHLVGPGEIVDQTQWGLYSQFTDMLVAETEHGVMFYGYWDQHYPLEDYEVFSCREKTGKLTFLAPPSLGFSWAFDSFDRTVPLYLFDDYPEAVRAEASVHAKGTHQVNDTKSPFDMRFEVSADRFSDGVFRFLLELESGFPLRQAAAQLLTEISTTALMEASRILVLLGSPVCFASLGAFSFLGFGSFFTFGFFSSSGNSSMNSNSFLFAILFYPITLRFRVPVPLQRSLPQSFPLLHWNEA